MGQRQIRFCDECTKERNPEVNHWMASFPDLDGTRPIFMTSEEADKYTGGLVRYDLCGQECAMKLFSRWMETGSILKQDVQAKTEEGQ